MRKQNSRETILRNRTQILNNIKRSNTEDRKQYLRAQGHIPLEEARKEGFKKVGFDVFQRADDADAGRIWSIEEIDGEKWLVCYTDKNDQIVRTLAKAAKAAKLAPMQKTATKKTAAGERVINPGDLAEIRPHTAESINFKYRGHKGYVTAAMPDRSQLTFNDGSSLWIENKDLAVVRDARELGLGDTVRMFARHNIQGKVTKFSYDKKAIYFEDENGNQFVARVGEVVKWVKTAQYPGGGFAIQNIWIDPNQPEASKLLREYMKGQMQQQQMMQNAPDAGAVTPENETVQPGVMTGKQDAKVPPSIKAQPSQSEINSGTAIPAGDLFGTPVSNSGISMAANIDVDLVGVIKHGRTLNIGDMVQKKSTGQTGFIIDINFDRKLGKFYIIDYGDIDPVIEYDTDIRKVQPGARETIPSMPQDYTRTRERDHSLRGESRINPQLTPIKEAATEFVNGMLEQARASYETQYPGEKVSQTLEENMIKQAIETYMSRYLPQDQQQMLSADDKNALSKEVFQIVATESGIVPEVDEAPTTENFIPPETFEPDMWDLERNRIRDLKERTASKIIQTLDKFKHIDKIAPTKISVLRDKQAFVQQAATAMLNRGVPKDIAHLIANQLTSFAKPNISLLVHGIKRLGFADHTEEIFKTAADALALSTFTTVDGKKYALDLPGMETLRGGGGGYPGGMDVEPMGWEVRNPDKSQTIDNVALEQALNENLEDQSKPFEEAGPKINIELDPENKQIVIDYGEEDDKAIELEPSISEEDSLISREPSPNMPQPGGSNSPLPGQAGAPGGNIPEQGFNDQDIPVNF